MRVLSISWLLLFAADAVFGDETDETEHALNVTDVDAVVGAAPLQKDNVFDTHVQARHAKGSKGSKSKGSKSSKGSKGSSSEASSTSSSTDSSGPESGSGTYRYGLQSSSCRPGSSANSK